jgi:trimeric autotransporter adhesin
LNKTTIKFAKKKRKNNNFHLVENNNTDLQSVLSAADSNVKIFIDEEENLVSLNSLTTAAAAAAVEVEVTNINNKSISEGCLTNQLEDEYNEKEEHKTINEMFITNEIKSNNLYNLYHVVLERSQLENWNNISSSCELDDLDENFTIVSHKPLNKSVPNINDIKSKSPATTKSLYVCELELWSNMLAEKPIVSSMSKSVGSITDQYLSFGTSTNTKTKAFNYTEINNEKDSNDHLSDTISTTIPSQSSAEITNNKTNKLNEIKLNDSGYLTVPPTTVSRIGSSSNEEEEEEDDIYSHSSPVIQLENQLLFYKRVEQTFFNELEKTSSISSSITSPTITPNKRRSRATSMEQSYFNSINNNKSQITSNNDIIIIVNDVLEEIINKIENEIQYLSSPLIIINYESSNHANTVDSFIEHENLTSQQEITNNTTRNMNNLENNSTDVLNYIDDNDSNEKITTCFSSSMVVDQYLLLSSNKNQELILNDRKNHSNIKFRRSRIYSIKSKSEQQSENNLFINRAKKFKSYLHMKNNSFKHSMSPVKKKQKTTTDSSSLSSSCLNKNNNEEFFNNNEDEFFLAISSSRLETGSCPEFYWYPVIPFTNTNTNSSKISLINKFKRRSKSLNDIFTKTNSTNTMNKIKSYENIKQINYFQMVNSMITGAISDVADIDYAEYMKRHLQGLFDNFTPVLMKSRSNDEMTIHSPSRDQIIDILSQSIPKSFSFDLKFLEEEKKLKLIDPMDFSKFGLGIKNTNDFDTNESNQKSSSLTSIKNSFDSDELLLVSENMEEMKSSQIIDEFLIVKIDSNNFILKDQVEEDDDELTMINAQNESMVMSSSTLVNNKQLLDEKNNNNENDILESTDIEAFNSLKELNISAIEMNEIEINNKKSTTTTTNNKNNNDDDDDDDDVTQLASKLNRTNESFSTIVQSNVTMTTDDENNLSNTLLANISSANSSNNNNNNSNNTNNNSVITDSTVVFVDVASNILINENEEESILNEEENLDEMANENNYSILNSNQEEEEEEVEEEEIEDLEIFYNDELGANSSCIIDTFENHLKENLDYEDIILTTNSSATITTTTTTTTKNEQEQKEQETTHNQRQRCSSLHDNIQSILNESTEMICNELYISNNSSNGDSASFPINYAINNNNNNNNNTQITTTSPSLPSVSPDELNSFESNKQSSVTTNNVEISKQDLILSPSSSSSSNEWLSEYQNTDLDLINRQIVNEIVNQIIESERVALLNSLNNQEKEADNFKNDDNEHNQSDIKEIDAIKDLCKNNKSSENSFENSSGSTDDLEIECKVAYFIKTNGEDFHSSSSSSSSSSSTTTNSELGSPPNERESDYDNINEDSSLNVNYQTKGLVVDTKYAILNDDKNDDDSSNNEIIIEQQTKQTISSDSSNSLDRFVAFNDLMSKSNSDEEQEEEDCNGCMVGNENEFSNFNFNDDFTDLNKQLDENWIQEDELIFGGIGFGATTTTAVPNMKLTSILKQMSSMFNKPRMLHPIQEEECSLSSVNNNLTLANEIQILSDDESESQTLNIMSNSNSDSDSQIIKQDKQEELDARKDLIAQKDEMTKVDENLESSSTTTTTSSVATEPAQNKLGLNDSLADEEEESSSSSQTREKLRTKQCDIDSLLGGMISTYEHDQTNRDDNQSSDINEEEEEDEEEKINSSTDYSEKVSINEYDLETSNNSDSTTTTEDIDATNAIKKQNLVETNSSKATENDIILIEEEEEVSNKNDEILKTEQVSLLNNENNLKEEENENLNNLNVTKFTKTISQTEAATENDASDFESDEYLVNQTVTSINNKLSDETEEKTVSFTTAYDEDQNNNSSSSIRLEPDVQLELDQKLVPDKQHEEESNNQIEELMYPMNESNEEEQIIKIENNSNTDSKTLIHNNEFLLTDTSSSNENFEIIYECQIEHDDDIKPYFVNNYNHNNNNNNIKSGSDIDISKLKLNIPIAVEELNASASNKLKEVILDIEKEIDNSLILMEVQQQNMNLNRPTTLALNKQDLESSINSEFMYENERTDTELEVINNKRIVESKSWPMLSSKNADYDLLDEKLSSIQQSITADRLNEAEENYIGLPDSNNFSKKRENFLELTNESMNYYNQANKIDKSYQVNLIDLPNKMIDTETQMTPPASPPASFKDQNDAFKPPATKINVATETEPDIIISNSQISNEEELLMKKLIEKENLLKLTSISTQTASLEELVYQFKSNEYAFPTDIKATISEYELDDEVEEEEDEEEKNNSIINDIHNSSVVDNLEQEEEEQDENDDGYNELNDQQCLTLLQDMKKMDDDLKMELTMISNEDENKSELFNLIKNYSNLDQSERIKLEKLITSNLKNAENSTELNKICKINNISLDNYLKSLTSDSNLLKINQQETDKNKISSPASSSSSSSSSAVSTSSTSASVTSSSTSLSNRSESLLTVDVNGKKCIKKNKQRSFHEFGAQTDPSDLLTVNTQQQQQQQQHHHQSKQELTSSSSLALPELSIKENNNNNNNNNSDSNNYNSHFIDLLSLNLDRSKTWVEMTEAKLNYMIGETDAVLKSMCFESSDEEKIKKSNNVSKSASGTNSDEMEANSNRHNNNNYQISHSSDSSCSSSSSPRIEAACKQDSKMINNQRIYTPTTTNIQEMTKLYLDNYKRQLQESKNELNSKINLLDKEKEKVSRIRDIKKRELYMRRQAAIEAFRLERERELNAQISKIDELRGAIDECKTDNNKIKTDLNYENIKDIHDFLKLENLTDDHSSKLNIKESIKLDNHHLPSQNREKLAKLRRNLILNSNQSLNNNSLYNIGSDALNSTINNNNNNNATNYYDDYSQSLNNTPRSCNSCFSSAELNNHNNNYKYKTTTNDLNKENYTSCQTNKKSLLTSNSYSYMDRNNVKSSSGYKHSESVGNCMLKTAEASSSSFIYKPTLTSSPNNNYNSSSSGLNNNYYSNSSASNRYNSNVSLANYNQQQQHLANNSSLFTSNSMNNNLSCNNSPNNVSNTNNPMMVIIPLRNRSYSSTPVANTNNNNYSLEDKQNYNGYQKTIPIEKISTNLNSIPLNIERSRSHDTRLLIPVISTNTITTTTTMTNLTTTINSSSTGLTTNVKSNTKLNEINSGGGGGGCSTSIVDESRLLLKEYEQLRNDSVSEIQRAHDSLNASLVWLENQKLK